MAKICIICGKEVKKGHRVLEDIVIKSIRRIKQVLGFAKNNELFVCESCLEEYRKKRQRYEKNLMMHIILAGFVFVVVAFLPIFTGGFSLYALLAGIILALLLVGLSIFSYFPKIEEKKK